MVRIEDSGMPCEFNLISGHNISTKGGELSDLPFKQSITNQEVSKMFKLILKNKINKEFTEELFEEFELVEDRLNEIAGDLDSELEYSEIESI